MTLDPSNILLTDRIAVVTGAGAGIGRGIAAGLKAFGAKVAASAAARIVRSGTEKPNRKAVAADISRKPRRDRLGSSLGTEEEAREIM